MQYIHWNIFDQGKRCRHIFTACVDSLIRGGGDIAWKEGVRRNFHVWRIIGTAVIFPRLSGFWIFIGQIQIYVNKDVVLMRKCGAYAFLIFHVF